MLLMFLFIFLLPLLPAGVESETAVQYKNQAAYEEFLEIVERDQHSPEERQRKQRLLAFPNSIVCRNSSSVQGNQLFTATNIVCHGDKNSYPICKLQYNHHEKSIISDCLYVNETLRASTRKFCNLVWDVDNEIASCTCQSDKCNTHAKDIIRDSLAAIGNRHRRHQKREHQVHPTSNFHRQKIHYHHRLSILSSSFEPKFSIFPHFVFSVYILINW